MLKSGTNHWGSLAKFFHWTIVVLILVQGTIGLVMVELPKRPNVIAVFSFHKSLGLTILALAILRLVWRAFDPHPRDPPTMPRWQALGARAGHALLYLLIFLVPLSGWWFDSVASLRPLYWWGLVRMPALGGPDAAIPNLKDIAAERHELLFWVLVIVAAGHAAMALIHHFHNRDGVLKRMLPFTRS
ncbi:MAG: cytochrome b [Proteobacteria bacterium]|nr:cytochrome b [Pseudomonadota bacterium]